MKTSTFPPHPHHNKTGHKTQKRSIRPKKEKHSFRRFVLKAVVFIALVGILWIYGYIFLRILNKRNNHFDTATATGASVGASVGAGVGVGAGAGVGAIVGSTTNIIADTSSQNSGTKTNTNSKPKNKSKSKAVLVIAAAPFHRTRALALWSQLECFTSNIDKVIISAADYSKDLLDPFIQEAIDAIPHLSDGSVDIEVRYYKNDNYDMGLWCDALKNDNGVLQGFTTNHQDNDKAITKSNPNAKSPLQEYDHFILINDSILAIRKYSGIIDTMRAKNLTMSSLTYSLLGKTGYWLEANYRAFNLHGVKTLMDHTCEEVKKVCKYPNKHRCHRCLVDRFEIPIAGLFERKDTWGMYHGDASIEYFSPATKNKPMQTSPMWTSNYPYWNEVLRAKQNFPATKISNWAGYNFVKARNKEDHDRCLSYFYKSDKAEDLVKGFEELLDKTLLKSLDINF